MKCPVCKDITLLMSEKNGIEIDYCPECRGVWLDRGELEKLMNAEKNFSQNNYNHQTKEHYHHDNDDYHHNNHHGSHQKKKSFFEGFDLFD